MIRLIFSLSVPTAAMLKVWIARPLALTPPLPLLGVLGGEILFPRPAFPLLALQEVIYILRREIIMSDGKERMTIHKGLSELKMLNTRIAELTRSSTFVAVALNGDTKINGLPVAEYKEQMRGNFDRINSLIDRRRKIKTAIMLSNASTIVEIAEESMLVIEAIERKASLDYEKYFLGALKTQFSNANARVTVENEKLPAKLETYLHNILGDKNVAKAEDIRSLTELFNETRVYELLDPSQLAKNIPVMEDRLAQFGANVDAALSESNSVTYIEI